MAERAPVAIVPAHRHGNEGCEPKDHGDELNSTDGELVGSAREAGRCEGEVGHSEQSPKGCEQHEVDTVWRPVPTIRAMISVDDCSEVSIDSTKKSNNHSRNAVNPSTMMENKTCTPRRPRTRAGATMVFWSYLMQGAVRCRWRRPGRMQMYFATEI
jgi:hypothetical protein